MDPPGSERPLVGVERIRSTLTLPLCGLLKVDQTQDWGQGKVLWIDVSVEVSEGFGLFRAGYPLTRCRHQIIELRKRVSKTVYTIGATVRRSNRDDAGGITVN
jgi:hypothetical protein